MSGGEFVEEGLVNRELVGAEALGGQGGRQRWGRVEEGDRGFERDEGRTLIAVVVVGFAGGGV